MPKQKARVISADVYDALELQALALGGIGAGRWFRADSTKPRQLDISCPVCINGMGVSFGLSNDVLVSRVREIGVSTAENDTVVSDLRAQGKGIADEFGHVRVPFADYAKKLNLVRGN